MTVRVVAAVVACSAVAGGTAACSADPTDETFAAPGITSQQPSDGTPVTVELVSPDGCPVYVDGSERNTLVADGSLPERVSGCEEHDGRGVYTYAVRMHGSGELVLSTGQSNTTVDVAAALASGQVSLVFQRAAGGQYDTTVEYSLFTDA